MAHRCECVWVSSAAPPHHSIFTANNIAHYGVEMYREHHELYPLSLCVDCTVPFPVSLRNKLQSTRCRDERERAERWKYDGNVIFDTAMTHSAAAVHCVRADGISPNWMRWMDSILLLLKRWRTLTRTMKNAWKMCVLRVHAVRSFLCYSIMHAYFDNNLSNDPVIRCSRTALCCVSSQRWIHFFFVSQEKCLSSTLEVEEMRRAAMVEKEKRKAFRKNQHQKKRKNHGRAV